MKTDGRARSEVFDVEDVRSLFPALARPGPGGRPYVWTDVPGGSQVPLTVIDAMVGRMRSGASNDHGAFELSQEIDGLISDARAAGASFLACDPGEVVFGQNTTSLLIHLARSFGKTLQPGDEVMVTRLDHDANVRPWVLAALDAAATIRWIDVRPDDVTLDLDSFDSQLSERTRLVAVTLASNAVGTMPPIARVVRAAKAAGALVALDGVHFAQHRAVDLHGLGADLVATSPYKFFGPHQGMLGVRQKVLELWAPYKLRPADGSNPARWETGTQNHEALAGTIAAVDYIAGIGSRYGVPIDGSRRVAIEAGFAVIAAHEHTLTLRFLDGLQRLPHVRLLGIADPSRVTERTPTFAIRVEGRHPQDVATALNERGIFSWDGHYFAIELFERLGLIDSGGAVRIGFCHYHTLGEVDRVLEALADIARG